MRMFVSANKYLGHTNLLTLFNLIREIHPWSLSGLGGQIIDGGMKLGIWKALVVIEGQDVVTIAGDVEIGKRLASRGPNHARKLVIAQLVVALEREIGDTSLQALLNAKRNEEIAGVTFVIVHQIAVHLHIAKTVGLIKLDKRRHVIG